MRVESVRAPVQTPWSRSTGRVGCRGQRLPLVNTTDPGADRDAVHPLPARFHLRLYLDRSLAGNDGHG